MNSEGAPVIEFAAFDPAAPLGTDTLDGLMQVFRDRGIEIWSQAGRFKARPGERLDEAARRAIERYHDLLVWACERRLNPAWWRPASEIWFGDRATAIEWQWRKGLAEQKP